MFLNVCFFLNLHLFKKRTAYGIDLSIWNYNGVELYNDICV